MESKQYTIRSENIFEKLGLSIQDLYGLGELTDVTLACENVSFKSHKLILSACSPYFRRIIGQNPCKHPIIILQNVDAENIQSLLQFIYCGEVSINVDSLSSFLTTAKFFQIQGLNEIKAEFCEKSTLKLFEGGGQETADVEMSEEPVNSKHSLEGGKFITYIHKL